MDDVEKVYIFWHNLTFKGHVLNALFFNTYKFQHNKILVLDYRLKENQRNVNN